MDHRNNHMYGVTVLSWQCCMNVITTGDMCAAAKNAVMCPDNGKSHYTHDILPPADML